MTTALRVWLTCLLALSALALAQERHNFLAVNNRVLDDSAGPFYFIAQGNNRDAFALAGALATSLGARLSFDSATRRLTFYRDGTTVVLRATADINEGLVKQPGALTVNGVSRDSPLGILVGGRSFVAITPLAEALGARVSWDSASRVIFIDDHPALPTAARLGRPDIGLHDGFTRVALSLPIGVSYRVAVNASQLVVTFTGVQAEAFSLVPDSPNVRNMRLVADGDGVTLIIQSAHPLTVAGQGFRVGYLPPDGQRPLGRLFIDFGAALQGQPVEALQGSVAAPLVPPEAPRQPSSARPPAGARPVIIVDAGHGGHDGGAQGFVNEKVVVLALSLKVQALLEAAGFEVIMSRAGDYFISLPDRSALATPERSLFVSIHVNSAENTAAHGIETWVFGQPLNEAALQQAIRENGGGELGRALTSEALSHVNAISKDLLAQEQLHFSRLLAQSVQSSLIAATGAADRGVRQSAFYVLRNARIPAVLLELGFVRHPVEGPKLGTESYQTKLAEAIVEGIINFYEQNGAMVQR
ncbi:MAG: N-acetylmuramoyl-L-alanine amidase [Truepera sp.]|nr:N-acetylmuramoyl-L-alanine amidase [Truepera sp.]